ncbi:MAG: hypothetical protein ABJB12_21435 [Pseudomonadota bacterium]
MFGSLSKIRLAVAAVVRAKVAGESWLACSVGVLDGASEGRAIEALNQLGQELGIGSEVAQSTAHDGLGRAA